MMHLIIDGRVSDKKILLESANLEYVVKETVKSIKMHPIAPTHIIQYGDAGQKDSGLSCCQMLAESSITIHTFPEINYICIDVFSCKNFDAESLKKQLVKMFGIEEISFIRLLDRTINFD